MAFSPGHNRSKLLLVESVWSPVRKTYNARVISASATGLDAPPTEGAVLREGREDTRPACLRFLGGFLKVSQVPQYIGQSLPVGMSCWLSLQWGTSLNMLQVRLSRIVSIDFSVSPCTVTRFCSRKLRNDVVTLGTHAYYSRAAVVTRP